MSATKRKAPTYDPYAVLGLEAGSSSAQIDKAFKKAALKWHPDKNKDNVEEANKKFIEIYKAYDFLKDDAKRTEFDEAAAAKKQRAAYEDQRKAASSAKRQHFLDKLADQEKAFETKQRARTSRPKHSTNPEDEALIRNLRAEGAALLRRMAEEAAAAEAARTRTAAASAPKSNGSHAHHPAPHDAHPLHMTDDDFAALEAEVLGRMTADKKPKHGGPDGLDDAQKQLEGLTLDGKKTNVVDHQLPERQFEGRLSIELGEITQHNLMQVKRLNEAVFPVTYNERFYQEVAERSELAKVVYFNDCIVGAVCCRLETKDNEKKLYIMTLGVIAAYRRFGVGGMLLNYVLELCDRDPAIKSVVLHVQINNESALSFYERFGFKKTSTLENYYKKVEPNAAFVLEKAVNCFEN
ncbi:N-alpha-acetyltransferase 50 [Aphelenchoides fujianensis]|nr:N-alpha-acetyltransferase 50 [Aphelenchoides fujianensis]